MDHYHQLIRSGRKYGVGFVAGAGVLVVDALYFVDHPVLNTTLFLCGLGLLCGSMGLMCCMLRCPDCGRSIGKLLIEYHRRRRIRYCPFCGYDLHTPSES